MKETILAFNVYLSSWSIEFALLQHIHNEFSHLSLVTKLDAKESSLDPAIIDSEEPCTKNIEWRQLCRFFTPINALDIY